MRIILRKTEFCDKIFFFFLCERKKYKKLEKKLITQIKPKYNINWGSKEKKKRKPTIKKEKIFTNSASTIKRLCNIMAEKNITQANLARLLDMSRQRVNQIIIDKKDLHELTIRKIELVINDLRSQKPYKNKEFKNIITRMDVNKIRMELKRLGRTQTWLSKEIKISKQLMFYWFKTKNILGVK